MAVLATSGTDPEINQGGWLGYKLGFRLDLSYIVSITIALKFKDMKWGVWQNVGLACLVCESMLFLQKNFENLLS